MNTANTDINFIPEDVVKYRQNQYTKSSGNKFFVALTILLALAAGGILYYNYGLAKHLNEIGAQIDSNKAEIEGLNQFGQEGYKLGVRLENAKAIFEKRSYYSEVYKDIVSRIPSNIEITQWAITDPTDFVFSGYASPNYTPIADFRDNLLKPGQDKKLFYTDARLVSSNFNKTKGKIEFVMQISVNKDKLDGQTE